MKINSLLAGTLAFVLIAGLGSPAFAVAPEDNVSNPSVPQVSVPQGTISINFDTLFSILDNPVGNEYAAQGILFSTPDMDLLIGSTVGSPLNSLGATVTGIDFDGDVVMEFIGASNCALDLEFLIFNTPFSATAFDIDGNPLATLNSAGPFSEIFSFAGLPVHKVQTSGTLYGIDDVTYTLESCAVVGGELLLIDSTALLLAGAQTFSWMIPVVLSVLGIGLFVVSRKSENS